VKEIVNDKEGKEEMFKNNRGQVRAGWLILLALFTSLFTQVIFSIPGYLFAIFGEAKKTADGMEIDIDQIFINRPWLELFTEGIGYIGGIVALLLLWKFVNKKKIKEMGFKNLSSNLIIGLVLGAISITIIFFILLVTDNLELKNGLSSPDFSIFTLTYLVMFILVGFSEELTFRGYIMSTLADRGNSKWVIYIVSSIIFGLVHILNPNVAVLGIINIFLVGLLFAYMYVKTQSLWMPIGYHITWNYFQGNVFGFAVSGTDPHGVYEVNVTSGNDLLTGGSFGLEGGVLATLMIALGFLFTYFFTRKKANIDKEDQQPSTFIS